MLMLEAETTNQIAAILAKYDGDVLYRGQLKDYGSETASGIRTSFDRNGCSPPTMLKWAHYAEFALRQLLPNPDVIDGIEFVQAVLQHYGWSSFFLDASADPTMSAWFAGHAWSSSQTLELVEDCFENPIMLRRELAHYEAVEGIGFLYILSVPELERTGLTIYDLSVLQAGDTRPLTQKARLVGPLNGSLPRSCVVARIAAPRAVMRAFAAQHGYQSTEDLFPGSDRDLILRLFLSLPWTKLRLPDKAETAGGIEFFARVIELPEYDHVPLPKHLPPAYAFFRHERLERLNINTHIIFKAIPSEAVFGRYNEAEPLFPHVTALVRRERRVAFELDELIWIPEAVTRGDWGKGLLVELRDDDLIAIGDLIVTHPGRMLDGFGANTGWSYRVDADGRWTRVPAQDDCPCGNEWRHRRHLSSLAIIEHNLAEERRT